jgi:phage protein D
MAKAEAMKQLSDMHMSIQELEKERDEVMNAIETQIENVMVNILDDRSDMGLATEGLRTPTGVANEPSHSPSAWKRTSETRPRRGTVVTFTSQDTEPLRSPSVNGGSHSMSDTKQRRSSVVTATSSTRDPLRQLDHRLTIKSEKMAEKMASIQRKVSMVLYRLIVSLQLMGDLRVARFSFAGRI